MFRLTNFLVENFVKCQFISLLEVLLHHTANAVNTKWWGRRRRIGLINTITKSYATIISSQRCSSCPPPAIYVIPPKVWDSPKPSVPRHSICGEGRATHGRLQWNLERDMLPWGQVLMRIKRRENESISTPFMSPLTVDQHPTYCTPEQSTNTYTHDCRHNEHMQEPLASYGLLTYAGQCCRSSNGKPTTRI